MPCFQNIDKSEHLTTIFQEIVTKFFASRNLYIYGDFARAYISAFKWNKIEQASMACRIALSNKLKMKN